MNNWINLDNNKKLKIFNQTAAREGLPAGAIEKDWWITKVLEIIYSLPFADHLVFKGGTSLSKGWNLIDRFSEDIDLVLDRKFLGFDGDLSKSQITKLRRASCEFLSNDFFQLFREKIDELQLSDVELKLQPFKDSDTDPIVIEFHTKSITENLNYLLPQVLIEIGSRSLIEPFENRKIHSLVAKNFSDKSIIDLPIDIPTVLPKRTFLEKIFLLHEEFQKPNDKIRIERLSRHLYDIEKLMDTEHCEEVLTDRKLYQTIVQHRKIFNKVTGIDYLNHSTALIDFIPPESIMKNWKKDYIKMQGNMIFGESLKYEQLIERLITLRDRFHKIPL